MNQTRFAILVLRLGVAFAFLYAAIAGHFNPTSWIGYFPQTAITIGHSIGLSDIGIISVWGLLEVIIALWILSGKKIFLPSLVSGLLMIGVVIANWAIMDVVFRDVTIAMSGFALALLSYKD